MQLVKLLNEGITCRATDKIILRHRHGLRPRLVVLAASDQARCLVAVGVADRSTLWQGAFGTARVWAVGRPGRPGQIGAAVDASASASISKASPAAIRQDMPRGLVIRIVQLPVEDDA